MELLTAVVSRLLSMALTALPVMGAVLLMRLALHRAPRKYSYALWLAVGFRLACPVSTEDLWSIFELPGLYDLAESTGAVGTGMVGELPRVAAALAPPSVTAPAVSGGTVTVHSVPVEGAAQVIPLLSDSSAISWSRLLPQIGAVGGLLGVIALLAVGVLSLVRLRRRLAGAVWCGGEVWESEGGATPFRPGLFPAADLPAAGPDGTERTCVLVHERHHIRRGDPWWKLLGWCILAA
jgi:beta-lactamase regulating signal transducer with metallopeptidase domain